jgi:hypothetical protein
MFPLRASARDKAPHPRCQGQSFTPEELSVNKQRIKRLVLLSTAVDDHGGLIKFYENVLLDV